MMRDTSARRAWAALAWAAGVCVAARVPALAHALPFLRVAAGPLGFVLLGVAVLVLVHHYVGPLRASAARLPFFLREPGPALLTVVLSLIHISEPTRPY